MDNYTRDGKRAIAGMRVYGLSPWAEVESLFVQLDQTTAGTCEPTESSGADKCTFPVSKCWADKDTARAVACTYVEDKNGFMVPPDDMSP